MRCLLFNNLVAIFRRCLLFNNLVAIFRNAFTASLWVYTRQRNVQPYVQQQVFLQEKATTLYDRSGKMLYNTKRQGLCEIKYCKEFSNIMNHEHNLTKNLPRKCYFASRYFFIWVIWSSSEMQPSYFMEHAPSLIHSHCALIYSVTNSLTHNHSLVTAASSKHFGLAAGCKA
jgi:hypothetical protein